MRIDEDCDDTFATIVHEVAHTWFHGASDKADWIDEGLANVVEMQVVAGNWPGELVYPPVTHCSSYQNIRELERGNPSERTNDQYTGFSCNYSLGDGIFGALREYYGDVEFNRRIAQLARRESNEADGEHTIADIRRVLGDQEQALEIIDLWYVGRPNMRKFRHMDAVEWSFPPTVDGEYLHFAGRISRTGTVHDFLLGDDPYCSQFALFEGIGNQEWVGNVSGPLPVRWKHREVPKAVVVNDKINTDSGEFSVTARINDPALSRISDLSLLVSSREKAGADNSCAESVLYSQVPVAIGDIPDEKKASKHYHADAVEWRGQPTIIGDTLQFSGRAAPGSVSLTAMDRYCSQFSFYEHDARGYHYIDSLNPFLPGNQYWTGPITAEVTSYHIAGDGTFEATATVSGKALDGYHNVVLVVTTPAAVNPATGLCGDFEVMSAIDVQWD